jgi:GDP/UDP-N,N'-diacetylbacillosamine 2-epimerase (hydrolysing)
MSHLHFVTTETHRNRVIQLGESPHKVFNVGALGVYNAKAMALYSKTQIQEYLNFEFGYKNLLITFHPITLEEGATELQFKELLSALNMLKNVKLIFTKPNADMEGRIIINMIDDFVLANPDIAISFTNLGTMLYLSFLQFVDGVVGNSSSGLIEAPTFKIGTVNIGDRQRGRVKALNVVDCEPTALSILAALQRILLPTTDFDKILREVRNPYEKENTVGKIVEILKYTDFSNILKKSFYNAECGAEYDRLEEYNNS